MMTGEEILTPPSHWIGPHGNSYGCATDNAGYHLVRHRNEGSVSQQHGKRCLQEPRDPADSQDVILSCVTDMMRL